MMQAATNSTLNCIAMRQMEGMTRQQKTSATTSNSYNVLSNHGALDNESFKQPFHSPILAGLMASTLEVLTLEPVSTLYASRSTIELYHEESLVL